MADDNIHALFGVVAPGVEGTPASVMELIADLYEQAQRGEVAAIAVAYTRPSRSVCTDWAAGASPANLLCHAAHLLDHQLMGALIEALEEEP